MGKTLKFEDDMYYSLNDMYKKTDLPQDLVRQTLIKHNVDYHLMLGKIRVYEGRHIEPLIQSIIEQGSKETSDKRQRYPHLDGDKDYNIKQATKVLGISEHTFKMVYLGINQLKYIKKIDGEDVYKGRAINKITHHINEGIPPIKPIRVEPRIYHKSEIMSKLGITVHAFNRIYIQTFNLNPTHIDDHHAYQGYIQYSGSEVNQITERILSYYGRVLP